MPDDYTLSASCRAEEGVERALLIRFGWLKRLRDARALCSRERLHFELLAPESQAVSARFGIESVWRVVAVKLISPALPLLLCT